MTLQNSEISQEQYTIELFRRAVIQHDPRARECVQQCFHETVLSWLRIHPLKETVCRFESEEHYVAQTFTRFWTVADVHQHGEFQSLASTLQYLQMSLNATLLDAVRTHAHPHNKPPLPEEEPVAYGRERSSRESGGENQELWEMLQSLLPSQREQRLAYLLFHCGLKPSEIMHFCPQEFQSLEEIYQLRRTIVDRVLRYADAIK